MGAKSRFKKERKSFVEALISYEEEYQKEIRKLLSTFHFPILFRNFKPTRSVIYACHDGYLIMRFTREAYPNKIEKIFSPLSINEILNKYKFKSRIGVSSDFSPQFTYIEGNSFTITLQTIKGGGEIYYLDYHTLMVFGVKKVQDPQKDAKNDFDTFLLAKNVGVNPEVDNYIPTTIERLMRLTNTFEELLEHMRVEEDIQKFIDDNPFVLNPLYVEMFPKVKVGKYVTDFVFLDANNVYHFVELERSDLNLFTKNQDLRYKVNHGWQQMEDWDRIIEEKKNEIESKLGIKNLENRIFSLVIGRSTKLTEEEVQKIRTRSRQSGKFELITYDDLLDRLKVLIRNLEK